MKTSENRKLYPESNLANLSWPLRLDLIFARGFFYNPTSLLIPHGLIHCLLDEALADLLVRYHICVRKRRTIWKDANLGLYIDKYHILPADAHIDVALLSCLSRRLYFPSWQMAN